MHSAYIKLETIISMVINTLFCAVFAWFPFRGVEAVPLWGAQGLVVVLLPTTFMITFMTTVAETLLTRKRLGAGRLAAPGVSAPAWLGWLPVHWLLRALALGLVMTVLLVPAASLLLMALGIEWLPWANFFAFKLGYGAGLALVVTPLILQAAINDKP